MTLNTHVHLIGPIPTETAFDLALRALLTAGDEMRRHDTVLIERNPSWRVRDSDYIGSEWGQGLPGITTAEAYADDRRFEPAAPDDVWGDRKPWDVNVSWDTGYGYAGRTWPTASSLHGAALINLHASLPHGVTLRWCNEFTDEWHDDLGGLDEFMGEGRRAHAFGMLAVALIAGETDPNEATHR